MHQYPVLDFGKNFTILYVEDEETIRDQMVQTLGLIFGNVLSANNGEAGLDMFQKHPEIDLLVTDLQMPVMTGLEMLKHVKEQKPSLQSVIITAHNENHYLEKAIEIGVDGFLYKPVSYGKMLGVFSKCIQYRMLEQENEAYKHNLEERVSKEVQKNREKDQLLVQTAKLASMGEMIDAIAHQWKSPLTIIDLHAMTIASDFESNDVSKEDVLQSCSEVRNQVTHLLETLHEFRKFLRPHESCQYYNLKHLIESVQLLLKDELIKYRINVSVEECPAFSMKGNPNELKHIFINLIQNAKDAFEEKECKERTIRIFCGKKEKGVNIYVEDNAGGIPEGIIHEIFKPDVTSKPEGKGSGVGLYISTLIAQKHGGALGVENTETGACFVLYLPFEGMFEGKEEVNDDSSLSEIPFRMQRESV